MTTDVKLLPLPEGEAIGWSQAWSHDQMRDYARANVEHNVKKLHKQFGCELQDPNGTIWEYAASLKKENERLAEALRLIESAKDRGFGIDYARGVAQSALRDHDQEVGNG